MLLKLDPHNRRKSKCFFDLKLNMPLLFQDKMEIPMIIVPPYRTVIECRSIDPCQVLLQASHSVESECHMNE